MKDTQRGFVYLALCDGGNVMKIGFTTKVQARMYSLKAQAREMGLRDDVALLCAVKGTPTLERKLLNRAAPHRKHGREWMAASVRIMELFEGLPQVGIAYFCRAHGLFLCEACGKLGVPLMVKGAEFPRIHRTVTRKQKDTTPIEPAIDWAKCRIRRYSRGGTQNLEPFVDYQPVNVL